MMEQLTEGSSLSTYLLYCAKKSTEIAVVFDMDLNYLAVSREVSRRLNKDENELIGRNIIDLFPRIIASENHRNLLACLNGQKIEGAIIFSSGELFTTFYTPVFEDNTQVAVFVHSFRPSFSDH